MEKLVRSLMLFVLFFVVVIPLALFIVSSRRTLMDMRNDVEGAVSSSMTYATYIQKNNRTVRVKNFDEVMPNMNVDLPSDEYIRFGLYYGDDKEHCI